MSFHMQRSSIPFSPNPDKLPPEVMNGGSGGDAGDNKEDYKSVIDRTLNSEQAKDEEAEL